MSLADRAATARQWHRLMTNPLAFLGATPLVVTIPVTQHDTIDGELSFSYSNNRASLGVHALVHASCGGNSDCIVQLPVRSTGTRGPLLATRTAATATMATVGADPLLWVTAQQSGCSVLVLDWGATKSMVHLQSSLVSQFRPRLQRLHTIGTPRVLGIAVPFGAAIGTGISNATHRRSLQMEFNQVVAATQAAAGGPPRRYILVQSNSTASSRHRLGVTGVRPRGGDWTFYLQEYLPMGTGVVRASQLAWSPWNRWWLPMSSWLPYWPSAY